VFEYIANREAYITVLFKMAIPLLQHESSLRGLYPISSQNTNLILFCKTFLIPRDFKEVFVCLLRIFYKRRHIIKIKYSWMLTIVP